jgi:hypothetical protein
MRNFASLLLVAFMGALAYAQQPIDQGYSQKIKQYTTDPAFLTEFVRDLPAHDKIPTTEKILGWVAGAPDKLTYAADVFKYLRALESSSPRIKTFTIGKSEEGREVVLAAISDAKNLQRLSRLKEITAKLADPRKITDAEAKALIDEGVVIYWINGALHSTETGSPEALMELAYRLTATESVLFDQIRKNLVVLLTPVIEVDGRERQVDLYRWKKENPTRIAPSLIYWGKYVAHDNNRDGMVLSLNVSKQANQTFLDYHPQLFHDLHESVPFLYVSTGMGPYNPWLDPILINEWQKLSYNEVEELTKRGVPGVWTHGFYDGWAANYMFTVANGHNAIGRFYETYGNGGADTRERTVNPALTSRTWFRPNPPYEKLMWSHRNNVNLQQSGLLVSLDYVSKNKNTFLENFYLKGKRSIAKAATEGPAAYVFPANETRVGHQAEMINLLREHGIEVHRLNEKTGSHDVGSFIVRMDQPYSRLADMLLDTQFYNPNDTPPYDDTGWTLPKLRNIQHQRIVDANLLKANMTLLTTDWQPKGSVNGTGNVLIVPHVADNSLAQFRFNLPDVKMLAAEQPFEVESQKFAAGSLLIDASSSAIRARIEQELQRRGLHLKAVAAMPNVATHPVAAPKIALLHNWMNTQNEGWYRVAFDQLKIPYTYLADTEVSKIANLRDRFDVIILGPVNATAQRIVNGIPKRGQAVPWKQSTLTQNFAGGPDQSDDIRGGLGLEGISKISKFVEDGGLFVTIAGNASLPIDYGLIDGVSIDQTPNLRVRGSVLQSRFVDRAHPIAYGFDETLPIYFNQAPVFRISELSGTPLRAPELPALRPSGRGSLTDPDVVQGRAYRQPVPPTISAPGQEVPLSDEIREAMRTYLIPAHEKPRVILRFGATNELLISGMLSGGQELANRPAVVVAPKGNGNILLFANNPIWRHETQGSFSLLFNAMMHFQHLDPAQKPPTSASSAADDF